MPARDRREHTSITHPQAMHTVHLQQWINDTTVLTRRHARGARRVVQCLNTVAHDRLDLRVRLLREVVIQQTGRVCSAGGIEQRGERGRAGDVRDEARCADEHGGVMLRREIPRGRARGKWRSADLGAEKAYSGSTMGATDGSDDRSLTVPVLVGLRPTSVKMRDGPGERTMAPEQHCMHSKVMALRELLLPMADIRHRCEEYLNVRRSRA